MRKDRVILGLTLATAIILMASCGTAKNNISNKKNNALKFLSPHIRGLPLSQATFCNQFMLDQQKVPRASLTAGVMMKAKTFPTAIHATAN